MSRVFIVGGKRTPIGAFMGGLSTLSAVELGAQAIRAAMSDPVLATCELSAVIIGLVNTAGLGQNPARQIAIRSGIDARVPAWSVNKVCASGLKAVMLAATSIRAGEASAVVAGGAESMSNAPHCAKVRGGLRFGDAPMLDSITHDCLTDSVAKHSMGTCAEKTATDLAITRQAQDAYCIASYRKAFKAAESGALGWEIVGVEASKSSQVTADEELKRFDPARIPQLKTAFPSYYPEAQQTVTAANSSKLNDGACALVLVSEAELIRTNAQPWAEIIGISDAETDSVDYNVCPALAVKKLLSKAQLQVSEIDLWEINEAFCVTVLANIQLLGLDSEKVNVHGGAVSIGHPIGMSGARIVLSLVNALRVRGGRYGVACICNGGGGSSAILIKSCFSSKKP